ncbi:MAG: DNA internalization-related competence protein ComEC/Rec2 [Ignavibacteria bacterium]|nr:DNA internalization-related competence protein ComEC/Rec2 [Ignavibacteria bacterium]
MKCCPAIKFTLIFSAGILASNIFSFSIGGILIFCGIVFSAILILLFYKKFLNLKQFLIVTLIFSVGFLNSEIAELKTEQISLPFKDMREVKVWSSVEEIQLYNQDAIFLRVKTDSIESRDQKIVKEFSVALKIKSETNNLDLLYDEINCGDRLIFIGNLYQPAGIKNPGEFDYKTYLNRKQISATGYADIEQIQLIKQNREIVKNFFLQIRKNIDKRIKELHNYETAGFLRGVLLADRSEISDETKELFINSGIVHLLAVSGLHVGFIIIIMHLLFARLNIHLRYFSLTAGILLFLAITGMPVSAVRASIMAILILAASYADRNYNPFNSLFLAVLLILAFDPYQLYNAGFQLSVSAVFSIIYFQPLFSEYLNKKKLKSRILKNFLLFASISIFAQLGTLPFTVAYFHKISVTSIFANIFAIPLAGIIIGNAFISILISILSFESAVILSSVTNFLTSILFSLGKIFGNPSFSYLNSTGLTIFNGAVYLLVIFLGLTFLLKPNKIKLKILIAILITLNLSFTFFISRTAIFKKNKLSILMIDVGQGDSFLISFPNGKKALIDAGNATPEFDCGKRTLLPLLEYLNIKKIDFVFISHIDADHYKGIYSLIEKGICEKIYFPVPDTSSQKEIDFRNYLISKKQNYSHYKCETMEIGNAKIYFLISSKISNFDSNNRSGIVKICYGNSSAIFTGDAEFEIESKLITKFKTFLDSDILKIGHHGSKKGTGLPFLKWVSPKYSLISSGKFNSYGHPSDEVIGNLKLANSKILRTDIEGAVLLESDGTKFKIINWKKELDIN